MQSILKTKKNNYNPVISSNTILIPSDSNSKETGYYLRIDKNLSEFETQEQKFYARKNLDVFSKEEINQLLADILQKDNDFDERLKKFEIWYIEKND